MLKSGMSGARVKHRVNVFEACDRAASMLEMAGFELRHRSSRTESCYYGWPGRDHTIRIAAHKARHSPIGMPMVAARITFFDGSCETPHHVAISEERFEHMVATAIGIYMLKSATVPASRYRGKKGTWEKGCVASSL